MATKLSSERIGLRQRKLIFRELVEAQDRELGALPRTPGAWPGRYMEAVAETQKWVMDAYRIGPTVLETIIQEGIMYDWLPTDESGPGSDADRGAAASADAGGTAGAGGPLCGNDRSGAAVI